MSLISPVAAAVRNPTLRKAALGLGCLVSALLLASGTIWYPLIEVTVVNPLAVLFAVAVGLWLGASWPAQLALSVGNASVIVGFIGMWMLVSFASDAAFDPIIFFGVALMFAFGYALVGGSLLCGFLRRWIRRS